MQTFLRILLSLCILSVSALASAFAETPPVAVFARLIWVDDEKAISLSDSNGVKLLARLGMELPSGTRIKTAATSAELQLVPNGSIIKLAVNTSFNLSNLVQPDSRADNSFSLLAGKVRMVAVHMATGSTGYEIRTPTAVAGVRGTDFVRQYDPALKKDWLCVLDGLIEFSSPTTEDAVLVPAGQFVSLAKGFTAEKAPQSWIDANLSDVMTLRSPKPGAQP